MKMHYKKLTVAVLLSCATMLAPFHAEAAHDAFYKLSEDGKIMSVYIDDRTTPFVNFMVFSAGTTGDSEQFRDFFTEGNGINIGTEQQAIANGIAYVKDLLGSPTDTPTIRLRLEAEVYNNAAAASDTMDNSNSALGNYFLLNAEELANYKFKADIDEEGNESYYADSCIWIWPRNTGWDATDVGNLSRNIDTQSMSSVIVHELFHALGMQFDEYYKSGDYKIGICLDEEKEIYANYANKFTLNSYDVYGKKAEVGDTIVYINAAEKDKYQATEGKFYMYLSNGYDAEGNAKRTYDSGCYFIGENVLDVLTINNSLANLAFPVDSQITVPGLPLNGDEGYPELSHIEMQNSFLSHQYFRNWSVPMEAELAMMQDLGYSIDRRNFFGYSVYNDGLTITNDNGYFKRNAAGTEYLVGEANKQDWGVGLHVYGQKNTITQTGNLLADGDYAIGIRLDGTKDNVLNLKSKVTANGKGGNGIAVTWGRNHTVNIESGSSVEATGAGGVALRFDFGHNDIGDDVPSTEIVGSYIYYGNYRHTAYNMIFPKAKLLTALDGPLVKECNIDGTIEGSKAAIYISKNALVKNININENASIKGDIISEWNPNGMWFSNSDPVFLKNFLPEGEDGLTYLNINRDLDFAYNIYGSDSIVLNIGADKRFNTNTGTASVMALATTESTANTVAAGNYVHVKALNIGNNGRFENNTELTVDHGCGSITLGKDAQFNNNGELRIVASGNQSLTTFEGEGTANLNGTLSVALEKGYYANESKLNWLAEGSETVVNSGFNNFIINEASKDALLAGSETIEDIGLRLENGNLVMGAVRAENAYSRFGEDETSRRVGQALDLNAGNVSGDAARLVAAFDSASAKEISSGLKQLNPSIYNSSSQAILATHNMLNNLMSTNMGSFSYHERPAAKVGGGRGPASATTAAFVNGGAGCVAAVGAGSGVVQTTPQPNKWRNIVIPFSSYTDQHNGSAAFTNHNSGLLGAVERTLDNGLTMGYHAALNHQSTSGGGATVKGEGFYLGAHASYAPAEWQGWEAFASARLGLEQMRSHRKVYVGGYSGSADANWTGYSGNLSVGGALTQEHGVVQSGPFVALDYSFAHRPSVNEKGGAIRTALASETYNSLHTQLGYRLSTKPKAVSSYDSTKWQAHASVAWNHELLSDNGTNSYSLADLPGVTIRDKSANFGRDSLGIMAGVTFKTPKKLDVTLSVGSDMYREGGHSIYGKANLEWKF